MCSAPMALACDGIKMHVLSVGHTCCRVSANGTTGMIRLKEPWCQQMCANTDIIVSRCDISWKDGEINFHADREDSRVFICPSGSRGKQHVVEIFAGLGGWTQAAQTMGADPVLVD